MNHIFSLFDKAKPAGASLIRLVSLLAIAASVSGAGRALGQDGRGHNRPAFDDGNSDSESYPFDSTYDANYGRNPSADHQDGRRDRSTGEKQTPARGMMGIRLRASDEGKVFVNAVFRGDPADRAGMRPGDKVLAIDGYEIGSLDDARRALRRHNADESVEFIIARNGRTREIDVPLKRRWVDPAEAIAEGTEEFSEAIGQAAAGLGSGVRRFSQAMRQDTRGNSSGRPRASVRDPYDRFSNDPEGTETDIDDETSDYSGEPQAVIEIDVVPPDQVDSAELRDPESQRSAHDRRDRTSRQSNRATQPNPTNPRQRPGVSRNRTNEDSADRRRDEERAPMPNRNQPRSSSERQVDDFDFY